MVYEHQTHEPGDSLAVAEDNARNNAHFYLQESLARWQASSAQEFPAAFRALNTLMLLVERDAREGVLNSADALIITQYAIKASRKINDASR